MGNSESALGQRLSMAQKEANGKRWYKQNIDKLDTQAIGSFAFTRNGMSDYRRMKVNYDLFNNKLDLKDFEYVCHPYGEEAGELPAQMVNRDIVSGKIKALMGMEMRLPFTWKVFAVNPEATTRKEQETFNRIREYVIEELKRALQAQSPQEGAPPQMDPAMAMQGMDPSQQDPIAMQAAGAAPAPPIPMAGGSMGMEQPQEAMDPPEIQRYMEREYQDPAEILAHQLLEYLSQKCDLRNKFSQGFKHMCLSAKEVFYVGIFNGEPEVWNVNSMRFNCDLSPDHTRIEDGEWATCEYRMTVSEVAKYFGEYLTDAELDQIYEARDIHRGQMEVDSLFTRDSLIDEHVGDTVRVLHAVWKALRKIKFLTYSDENGDIQRTIVSESYSLNEGAGDISIEEQWIPEVYEGWKIGANIYVKMQPVPGQFKDLDNLFHCKLPYYGAICDNMNSEPISIMDRLKPYQYYYNIVMYRLELMLASDKGKKVLMNINAIPDSAGIDVEKWHHIFESSSIMWIDPNEEGTNYNDVNTIAKQVDLSLASDISRYIDLAEYLRRQAGASIGLTERMEGEVGNRETSANYSQALQQSANILEPYFNLHAQVKRNVLEALLEQAKVAYSTFKPKKLTYILDDFSQHIINLDDELLDNSTYGLFISDTFKIEETKQTIQQLAHAALQNQQVELVDVIAVLRQESSTEAEEILKTRQKQRAAEMQKMQEQEQKAQQEEEEKKRQFERELHKMRMAEIKLKEEERRKTEIAKMSLTGASFNPNQDADKDGQNDFLEIAAKNEVKMAEIESKEALGREQMLMDRELQERKLNIEEMKVQAARDRNDKDRQQRREDKRDERLMTNEEKEREEKKKQKELDEQEKEEALKRIRLKIYPKKE